MFTRSLLKFHSDVVLQDTTSGRVGNSSSDNDHKEVHRSRISLLLIVKMFLCLKSNYFIVTKAKSSFVIFFFGKNCYFGKNKKTI